VLHTTLYSAPQKRFSVITYRESEESLCVDYDVLQFTNADANLIRRHDGRFSVHVGHPAVWPELVNRFYLVYY